MKKLEHRGVIIGLCTDIIEWGKEFYGLPEGAEVENIKELESECMGFASPDEYKIWIFLPQKYDRIDLISTVAHEVGHLMKVPSDEPEEKAGYYETYYLLVTEIIDLIQKHI